MYLRFLLGALTGTIITASMYYAICRIRPAFGVLRIDRSNPKKDLYRLDIDDLSRLSKKKRIVLKVDNNADLSQK